MNSALYRIVYVSHNEITGDDAAVRGEIEQILESARKNNAKSNISGALMFNAGFFAQVLEGEHDAVQDVFERISCDPRHSRVVVLALEPAERVFSDWTMAYFGRDTEASEKFGGITRKSGFDLAKLQGNSVFELLKEHMLEASLTRF